MGLSRVVPLLLVLASPALAEECQFDPRSLKPQFSAPLPKGFKLLPSKPPKRQLLEVLKLPDGSEVTLTVSGCESVAWSIAIKAPGLTTHTVGGELVAIARRVLPTLPMHKESTVDPKRLMQAIEDARISSLPAVLPCGDATSCQMLLADDSKAAKAKPKAKKGEPPADPPGVLKFTFEKTL